MTDPPLTRPSLLVRLRDARDADAWGQFVRLYAPLVYGYARKRNLQDADAADLTQEVLRAVARAAGRLEYDPQRGSFHGWLFTVVRNKVSNFQAARRLGGVGSGLASVQLRLEEQPAPDAADARQWEEEYRRQLFARAAAVVRDGFHASTWLAFWRTAVEGHRPRDVAGDLGLSVAAVYMARSRVTAQLKKQMSLWHED